MILRILVLFSSPFSSWEIPKYPLLSPKSLWPAASSPMTLSESVGHHHCPDEEALIGAMMMPNAFRVSSVTLGKPLCSKISGIPGQFSWAALERIEGIPCKTGGFTGRSAETNIDLVTSKLGGLWSHSCTKPLLTGVVPSQLSHHGS